MSWNSWACTHVTSSCHLPVCFCCDGVWCVFVCFLFSPVGFHLADGAERGEMPVSSELGDLLRCDVTCCDLSSVGCLCFCFVFRLFLCVCCLFLLIYFLSFNPALPSLSLFTCDSSLSYPGVRGCGWGQRQVGSIASCSCNLYPPTFLPPPHLPACWAVSNNFGGACGSLRHHSAQWSEAGGVGSHAILLAGLHTPGRKQPVACCIL